MQRKIRITKSTVSYVEKKEMTEEENDAEISQYPYSVKIAQTTYGARVSVHAYGFDPADTISHAMTLYDNTRDMLKRNGFKVAPEEPVAKNNK